MEKINVTVAGDTLTVREGNAPEIFQYEGYHYRAHSADAFVNLVSDRGAAPGCIIAYNDAGFQAIMDDFLQTRDKDKVTYGLTNSVQYEEWEGILKKGETFQQKQFLDFLRRREPGEIENMEALVAAIQKFKFVSTVTFESEFEDPENRSFVFKVGDMEGTVKLPQSITVNIEVYNESGYTIPMEIELEVVRPKSDGEKLRFSLTCPKLARYLKLAWENEVSDVHDKLEDKGFLIIAGKLY